MKRKLNLSKRKSFSERYSRPIPLLLYVLIALLFVALMYERNSSSTHWNERPMCDKRIREYYAGVVVKVDYYKGSKEKFVILEDGFPRYPLGLHHVIHKLSAGDSIVKKYGSLDYIVFPKGQTDTSYTLKKDNQICWE